MQSTLVRAACDNKTIRLRLKNWISRGYKLVATSTTPTFNSSNFTVEQIVKNVEKGVVVHLACEKSKGTIVVARKNKDSIADGYDDLMYGYEVKSFTNVKPLGKVRVSRLSTGISAH